MGLYIWVSSGMTRRGWLKAPQFGCTAVVRGWCRTRCVCPHWGGPGKRAAAADANGDSAATL